MANLALMQRIANEVETLISQNPKAVERFREQLKVFNNAWGKYYSAKDNELPILYKRPDKSIKGAYEYDRHFKCWIPKDTPTLPPDPTKWELDEKLTCYYGTLAVIYDLEKSKVAPFGLCEEVLDNYGFAFMQICISRAWGYDNDMLDTALKWVKKDIRELQEKGGQRRGQPKNKEAEKSIDSLKELLKNETPFSDMPKGTRRESWEWIAEKIGYPKNPQNITPRYKIMQGYLGRNCPKLYAKLKSIVEKN